jgi:hypothetical protein
MPELQKLRLRSPIEKQTKSLKCTRSCFVNRPQIRPWARLASYGTDKRADEADLATQICGLLVLLRFNGEDDGVRRMCPQLDGGCPIRSK